MEGVTLIQFTTRKEFEAWESKSGNCIYSVQDNKGNFLGDIREEDLIPLWDDHKLVNLDDPRCVLEEALVEMVPPKSPCNWMVTLDKFIPEVKEKLGNIIILEDD